MKNRVCQGAGENQADVCGVSPSPDCSFHFQPLFTGLNFSDSGADSCHVTRTSGWQKSGNEGPVFVEAEWTSSTCAATCVDSVAAAIA